MPGPAPPGARICYRMQIKAPGGAVVSCPRCHSTELRYSNGFNFADIYMYLRRRHALRCCECRRRFHARTDEAKNFIWTTRE